MQVLIIMMAVFTLLLMTADPRSDSTHFKQKQTSVWQKQDQTKEQKSSEDDTLSSDELEES